MTEEMSLDEVHIDELLCKTAQVGFGVSTLHLFVGRTPYVSLMGGRSLVELSDYEVVSPVHVQRLVYDILSKEQIAAFESNGQLEFDYLAQYISWFHVQLLSKKGDIVANFRMTSSK